ncbi:ArnT family glycosyltransferase [Peredibacter sp. HCB2-198]|uniref:ArnT family glycosyltransferase n=1 Tax=Peredibacter sp. HCB2-198 TaxID=3383025 RepID=UPI0038B5D2FA
MLRNKNVILLLIVGLVLRLVYVLWVFSPSQFVVSDVANYVRIAGQIGRGEWNDFHFFQPIGFPYLILFLERFFGDWATPLSVLQAITSTVTLFIIWKVSFETWGDKVAKGVLLIGTFHVPWIVYNGYGLSESLFTFGLSLLLYLGHKLVKDPKNGLKWGYFWGLAFLLSFLIKGNHAFYGPLFLLGLFISYKWKVIRGIFAISLIVGLGLLLHGAFSYNKVGKFHLTPTAGGLNFVEGKCPSKRNIDNRGILWVSPLYYQLGIKTEKRWPESFNNSGYFMNEGWKCIKENPLVLVQSLEGIFFLFMGNYLWPAGELKFKGLIRLYELIFAFFVIPGLVGYGLYLKRNNNREEFLVWALPVLSLFLCVYVFKSEIRFRIPFDVFIIPVAVRGWFFIVSTRAYQRQSLRSGSEETVQTDL